MSSTTVRTLAAVGATSVVLLLMAATAHAHEPTCGGLGGIHVHGQHVIGDYLIGGAGIGGGLEWPPSGQVGSAVREDGGAEQPGGPGRWGHFEVEGLAPGASFCNENAHPDGFNTPDHLVP